MQILTLNKANTFDEVQFFKTYT